MIIALVSGTRLAPVSQGDFCNLLQVAASALHLLDLKLDDDLRLLARAGLDAIRQAADCAQASRPATTLNLTRSISG